MQLGWFACHVCWLQHLLTAFVIYARVLLFLFQMQICGINNSVYCHLGTFYRAVMTQLLFVIKYVVFITHQSLCAIEVCVCVLILKWCIYSN